MYDSWSGTWSTQDIYRGTIRDPQSLHRSAFVNNNPVNFYDPDGFSAKPTSDDSQNYQTVLGQNQSLAPITPTQCEMVSKCQGYTVNYSYNGYDSETGDAYTLNGQFTIGLSDEGVCAVTCNVITIEDDNGNEKSLVIGAGVTANVTKKNGSQLGFILAIQSGENGQLNAPIIKTFGTSDAAWDYLGYNGSQDLINETIANLAENIYQSRQVMKHERDQIVTNAKIRKELAEQQQAWLEYQVSAERKHKEMEDLINYYLENRHWSEYFSKDGQLTATILYEYAIANGIEIDDLDFKLYLIDRDSALRDPFHSVLGLLVLNRSIEDEKAFYEQMREVYNNLDPSELTDADYYYLAQQMMALQEKDRLDDAGIVIGMTGGIVSVGSKVPGVVALGRNPGYKIFGESIGAKYLNISDEAWNAMSNAERWAVNQKFLDDAIARGDEFVLSHSDQFATEGSFFRRELDYLAEKGYRLSEDGLRLINPE